MKKWSLGYEILRLYVRFAYWLSHNRIVVTGRNQIPKGKPVIFAPNHQNALADPLALVTTNKHQTVWLARADIFKSKAALSFLSFIKMLPVYRIRDGKENLSNNENIFAQITDILENKLTVALFPEAAHSGKRQMLTHKKAIPRLALETEEKNNFNLDLQIVPTGIFYSHFWDFDRTLIVQYGNPIQVSKYRQEYGENPQKAVLSLRDEIEERLSPLTMQINSIPFYKDYENMRELAGKTWVKAQQFSKNSVLQRFHAEIDLIKKLEKLESGKPDTFQNLVDKTREYFSALAGKKLTDRVIQNSGNTGWLRLVVHITGAVFSLPIFIAGFLFNALPFFIPRNLIRKKVKDLAFMNTFNFAAGLLIFPMAYLIEAGILLALTKSLMISISAFILMPFAGKIAYKLLKFYQCVWYKLKFLTGNKSFRTNIKKLIKQRNELVELIVSKAKC